MGGGKSSSSVGVGAAILDSVAVPTREVSLEAHTSFPVLQGFLPSRMPNWSGLKLGWKAVTAGCELA